MRVWGGKELPPWSRGKTKNTKSAGSSCMRKRARSNGNKIPAVGRRSVPLQVYVLCLRKRPIFKQKRIRKGVRGEGGVVKKRGDMKGEVHLGLKKTLGGKVLQMPVASPFIREREG